MGGLDPEIAAFITETVARQGFRDLVGYEITALGRGTCEMALDPGAQHAQQDDLVHGGVIAAMADVAAGCAAVTLVPCGTRTATVEFKINLLEAGHGSPDRRPRPCHQAGADDLGDGIERVRGRRRRRLLDRHRAGYVHAVSIVMDQMKAAHSLGMHRFPLRVSQTVHELSVVNIKEDRG